MYGTLSFPPHAHISDFLVPLDNLIFSLSSEKNLDTLYDSWGYKQRYERYCSINMLPLIYTP